MFGILKKSFIVNPSCKDVCQLCFWYIICWKNLPLSTSLFYNFEGKKRTFLFSANHIFFFSKKWNLLFQYSPLLTFLYYSKFFGGQLSKDNWTNKLKSKDWVKAFWNGLIVCFLSILKFFFTSVFASRRSIMQKFRSFWRKSQEVLWAN